MGRKNIKRSTVYTPGNMVRVHREYQGQIAKTSTHTPIIGPLSRHVTPFGPGRAASNIYLPPCAVDPAKSITRNKQLHVMIASVPWRRVSLNRLIREISYQSLLPECVHIVLDGEPATIALDLSPLTHMNVKTSITEHYPPRGAGSRWRITDNLDSNDIVCNLDDDICLRSNEYLAKHYQAITNGGLSAVCAGGYTPSGELIMCNQVSDYTGPIKCFQAGAFTFRAGYLRGLNRMPMADEMLGLLGDDEGLVSAHLWKTSVGVDRVNTTVAFDPSAHDLRSQVFGNPGRVTRFRTRLKSLTGWPWGL